MANDIYTNDSERMIEELNKADKIGDILEGIIGIALGSGTSFIVGKAVKKIFTPTTIPEKILTFLGEAAIGAAVTGASTTLVHQCCHPLEQSKKQAIINETIVLSSQSNELTKESVALVRANQELTNTMLNAFVIPDDISTENLNTIQDVIKSTDISSEEKKDEQ